MRRRLTVVAVASVMPFVGLCLTCRRQPAAKPPDPDYRQLEQRYGSATAQASIEFKSLTPEDEAFYRGGGRMKQADIVLSGIQIGMEKGEIEMLLGKPSNTTDVGDGEHWGYTLFYSQALSVYFDSDGRLSTIDGYGADRWREANTNLSESRDSEGEH